MRRAGLFGALCACVLAFTAHAEDEPLGAAAAFLEACAGKAAAADKTGTIAVKGSDGWLFLARELRHVGVGRFWGQDAAKVSLASKPEWADPVPAIVDFKAQLDRAGIQLLLVPVPAKAFAYPDKVSDAAGAGGASPPPRLDVHHQAFYELLREKGVNVLDLLPACLAARRDDAVAGPVYCERDTHWAPRTCAMAARLIAEETADRLWLKAAPRQRYATEERDVQITGDLARAAGQPKETLKACFVGTVAEGMLQPVTPDLHSPVLLLGDSHCLVFHAGGDMHARGAGLADHLAAELGFAVDLLGVRASGATSARIALYRRARRDPAYLQGKKLIVWCFAAREFTESPGWRNVPVVK